MTCERLGPSMLLTLVAALAAVVVGCKNSDTITGVRQEPTPTPIPNAVNVAGAWTGTFNSFDLSSCDWNVEAQATLTQQGSTVDGTLNAAQNGCGTANVVIHATLAGTRFEGTIESSGGRYAFRSGSTVEGWLSGSVLTIVLRDIRGGYIPGGTMQLHR